MLHISSPNEPFLSPSTNPSSLAAATSTHAQGRFRISSRKLPISKAGPIDDMTAALGLPAVPEMIFGDNLVAVEHAPSGWRIEFNAFDALDRVDKTGERGLLQVAYAGDWQGVRERQIASAGGSMVGGGGGGGSNGVNGTRTAAVAAVNGTAAATTTTTTTTAPGGLDGGGYGHGFEVKGIVKPYDWSYSTSYDGTVSLPNSPSTGGPANAWRYSFRPAEPPTQIPLDLLRRRDPILFFDEVVLYESELDDNGVSVLSVKVRVHAERMLLLCRLFMRLDGVVLRVRDTRLYVDFETDRVVRDYTEREGAFQEVKQTLQRNGLLTEEVTATMRDANLVFGLLPIKVSRQEVVSLGST